MEPITWDSFVKILSEVLELDTSKLAHGVRLDEFDTWDSLAHISLVALLQERFGRTVKAQGIRDAKSVDQLYEMISKADA